ncbi:MAG TPA: CAP domain-containing protein [Tepidiformaceae bacterium]|nr:CAP domain-containing protein [Tepidiformaceae bacterium]
MDSCRISAWSRRAALLVVVAGAFAVGAVTPGTRAAGTCKVGAGELALNAEELVAIALINAERASYGLGPVAISGTLTQTAAWKASDLANGAPFGHVDSLGRDPHRRAAECGYPGGPVGENIAGGIPSASAVVAAWMASPSHQANLVASQYLSMGIAVAPGGNWVTNFGLSFDGPLAPGGTGGLPAPSSVPTVVATTVAPPDAIDTPMAPGGYALARGANFVDYGDRRRKADSALDVLGDALVVAYRWEEETGAWLRYIPSAPAYASALEWLEPGASYILFMRAGATWAP